MAIIIFHLFNYTLSFLMWMIIGRVVITLILGGRQNVMTLAFVKITEPVYRITRTILPFAKESCVPGLSVLLIIVVRLVFVLFVRPATNR
ncbi:MAG: hypothetical protein OHK006_00880 [Thermodesulfovibrionales bacterium]